LDSLRRRRESALATGGILAAVQVLGGAVETAQQYELQFAARDPKIVRPDSLVLRLTSRAHPIVGEHLAHFGAFLARPFREYDFYAGLYDALYFVASEYTCPAGPNGQADYQCIASAIAGLIGAKSLTLGSIAPPVLDTLFATEFSAPAFETQRRSLHASVRWGKTFDDSATTSVLLALHGALQKTQMTGDAASCKNLPLPHMLICTDRLDELVDHFRETKGVVRTVKQWRRSCEESAKKLEGPRRARACESAHDLYGLVIHPRRYAAQTTDRLLQRLWDVEHRVHRDFKRRADRDSLRRLGIDRLDAEVPTAVLLAQYRGRPLRPRYGWEWSTSSAPERARFVHYVVPYYFGFNVGDSGFELGYRPTYHLDHKWGITFPITSHWTTPVTQTATGVLIGEGKDWYAGAGAGIAGTGVIPRPVGLFLPEFGLTGQYWVPAAGKWDGNGRFVADAYADISLLAGRLRVAGRYTNREDQLFDGGKWAWSIGIADLNGLIYWLTRLQR